jgi:hypothetical protein
LSNYNLNFSSVTATSIESSKNDKDFGFGKIDFNFRRSDAVDRTSGPCKLPLMALKTEAVILSKKSNAYIADFCLCQVPMQAKIFNYNLMDYELERWFAFSIVGKLTVYLFG